MRELQSSCHRNGSFLRQVRKTYGRFGETRVMKRSDKSVPSKPQHFEWTFSSRIRERQCSKCPVKTTGFLTLSNGIRKPLCSSCFLATTKAAAIDMLSSFKPTTGVQQMKNAIYRQGDVLIRRITSLPTQKAQLRLTGILAYGEVTGHAHRLVDVRLPDIAVLDRDPAIADLNARIKKSFDAAIVQGADPFEVIRKNTGVIFESKCTGAEILEIAADVYLRVGAVGIGIVHDEHAPIVLPPGNAIYDPQREYTPEAIRNVAD